MIPLPGLRIAMENVKFRATVAEDEYWNEQNAITIDIAMFYKTFYSHVCTIQQVTLNIYSFSIKRIRNKTS